MTIAIGDKAPEIHLQDHQGNLCSSKALRGKPLVLFFYPKDETPVCIAEACGFRDNYDLFKIFGAEVWGVSADSEQSHLRFAEKNNLPFAGAYTIPITGSELIIRAAFNVYSSLFFI